MFCDQYEETINTSDFTIAGTSGKKSDIFK